jgi:hypothetical protein
MGDIVMGWDLKGIFRFAQDDSAFGTANRCRPKLPRLRRLLVC